MAVNIEVDSRSTGKVCVRVYCDDTTTPATVEHLMNCARQLHAEALADVVDAWAFNVSEANVSEAGD